MAWQTPRRNQDGVKTKLKFGMLGMRHQPPLRGVDDAPLLARRHRIGGVIEAGAGLDLDEGQSPSAPGDDVDLAARHPCPPCEDSPAMKPQVDRGETFGAAPALFGLLAVQRISSSTRA